MIQQERDDTLNCGNEWIYLVQSTHAQTKNAWMTSVLNRLFGFVQYIKRTIQPFRSRTKFSQLPHFNIFSRGLELRVKWQTQRRRIKLKKPGLRPQQLMQLGLKQPDWSKRPWEIQLSQTLEGRSLLWTFREMWCFKSTCFPAWQFLGVKVQIDMWFQEDFGGYSLG